MKGNLVVWIPVAACIIMYSGCQKTAENQYGLPSLSSLEKRSEQTYSSIDRIQNLYVRSQKQPISLNIDTERGKLAVEGWAVDAKAKDIAGGVYLDIDGKDFPAMYGFDRKDVGDGVNNPYYRYCGYKTVIPVAAIGMGSHQLYLKVLTKDKTAYYATDPSQVIKFDVSATP